jgi:hypothetical protein
MKTQDIRNIASAYMQVQEKAKMDPVNPDELKGTHAQRKDKDINNDGKVDGTDEYLHNRRKAVKQAMSKEAKEYGPGHIGAIQKMLDKERDAKKAMKKEASDTQMGTITVTTDDERKKRAQAYRDKQALMKKEETELDEAAPKIKPDFVKTQREKDRAHDAAMGRTATGRKKPERAMTSTQRSMASMRKEDTDMNNSRWPILQRIMERKNHGNMDNGSPRGEGLSPSAKTELSRSMGDSGIDGAKAAEFTAKAATANVKVAPKRPGDQTIGDKTPIDSTKA